MRQARLWSALCQRAQTPPPPPPRAAPWSRHQRRHRLPAPEPRSQARQRRGPCCGQPRSGRYRRSGSFPAAYGPGWRPCRSPDVSMPRQYAAPAPPQGSRRTASAARQKHPQRPEISAQTADPAQRATRSVHSPLWPRGGSSRSAAQARASHKEANAPPQPPAPLPCGPGAGAQVLAGAAPRGCAAARWQTTPAPASCAARTAKQPVKSPPDRR